MISNNWVPEFKDGIYVAIVRTYDKNPGIKILKYKNNCFLCHLSKISAPDEEFIESRERISLKTMIYQMEEEGAFIRPINNHKIMEIIGEEKFNEWSLYKIL